MEVRGTRGEKPGGIGRNLVALPSVLKNHGKGRLEGKMWLKEVTVKTVGDLVMRH